MSTDDPKEQGAPERLASDTDDKDDKDDTTGHRLTSQSADPDSGSRAPSRETAKADDNDDVEGHRLKS
jgi:hypothetical protein